MFSLGDLYGISWKNLPIRGYHGRFYPPNWLKMKICAWVLWLVLCCCDQDLVPSLVVADRGKGHASLNPDSETLLNKPDISASVDSKEETLAEKQSGSSGPVIDGNQPVEKVTKAASKPQHSSKPKTKAATLTVTPASVSQKSATDARPLENITSSFASDETHSSQPVDTASSHSISNSQSETSHVLHPPADHVVSSLHLVLDDLQAPIAQDKDSQGEKEILSSGLPHPPVESVRTFRVHEAKVVAATKEAEVQESALPSDHSSATLVIDANNNNNGTAASENPAPLVTDEENPGVAVSDEAIPATVESEIPSDGISEETPDAGSPAALEPFNQWAEKRRAEQKKIGSNVPAATSSQSKTQSTAKMRQKNYALADCGAKIIGTNSEAQNPSAVLNNYKDEYMLNPCTAKIWLVIELCEPIQASKLELANFELFSSSPRAFSVFSSDRYPSREWVSLGKFEALDEKTLQSFDLEPPVEQHFFYKYIKVEMASHYGSEHYCPVSMVRVYGTSELEVLETDENQDSTESQENDEDGLADDGFFGSSSSQPNLITSAKDAVINIVKKAAEALSRDKQPSGADVDIAKMENITEEVEGAGSQVHGLSSDRCITLLRPCSGWDLELRLGNASDSVLQFLSCNYHSIASLLELSAVKHTLQQCSCDYTESDSGVCESSKLCQYLNALLGPVRFSALCYVHKLHVDAARVGKAIYYPNCTGPPVLLPAMGKPLNELSSTVIEVRVTVPSVSQSTQKLDNVDELKVDIPISVLPTPKPTLELTIKVSDADALSTLQQTPRTLPVSQSIQEKIQPTRTLNEADVALNKGREEAETVGSASDVSEPLLAQAMDSSDEQTPAASVEQPAVSESESVSVSHDAVPIQGSLVPEVQKESTPEASSEPKEVDSPVVSEDASAASDSIDSKPADASVGSPDPNLCGEILSNGDAAFTDMGDLGMVPSAQTLSQPSSSSSTTSGVNRTSGPMGTQKESVFVRLSNRIKALEVNMSLSGQYLEELSQRYRKQMEEMQRAFNKTIGALNDTAKIAYERDLKQQEMITVLQTQIDNLSNTLVSLVNERDSFGFKVVERHFILIFVEVVIAACVFVMLKRRRTSTYATPVAVSETVTERAVFGEATYELESFDTKMMKRRNSFTGAVGHSEPTNVTKRRPSEEALNISGTYEDLMIVEPIVPITVEAPAIKIGEFKKKKQRNRKGSREFVRSASNLVLGSQSNRPVKKNSSTKVTSAGLLFGREASETIEQEGRYQTNAMHRHSSHPSAKPPRSSLPASGVKTGQANGKQQHLCRNGSVLSELTSASSVSSKSVSNGLVCNGSAHREEMRKEGFTLRKFIQKLIQ